MILINCSEFVLIVLPQIRICSTLFSPVHKDKDWGGYEIGKVVCHVVFVDKILETDGRNSVSLTLQWKQVAFH